MSVEGIFRKNGNIRRLKDLTEAIDHDLSSVDLTQDNPVQLAALLKKFLRELPEPLMTFKLHRLLIASQCLSPFTSYMIHDLTFGFQPFLQRWSGDVVSILSHYCFPRAIVIPWRCYLCS